MACKVGSNRGGSSPHLTEGEAQASWGKGVARAPQTGGREVRPHPRLAGLPASLAGSSPLETDAQSPGTHRPQPHLSWANYFHHQACQNSRLECGHPPGVGRAYRPPASGALHTSSGRRDGVGVRQMGVQPGASHLTPLSLSVLI